MAAMHHSAAAVPSCLSVFVVAHIARGEDSGDACLSVLPGHNISLRVEFDFALQEPCVWLVAYCYENSFSVNMAIFSAFQIVELNSGYFVVAGNFLDG